MLFTAGFAVGADLLFSLYTAACLAEMGGSEPGDLSAPASDKSAHAFTYSPVFFTVKDTIFMLDRATIFRAKTLNPFAFFREVRNLMFATIAF